MRWQPGCEALDTLVQQQVLAVLMLGTLAKWL